MASEKPNVVFDFENVFILQPGMNIYVKTADICSLLGVSNQWIGQLVSQGTLNKVQTDYGKLFNLTDSVKNYMDSLSEKVKKTEDEEVIWNEVKAVAQTALDRFVEMRSVEGVKMYEDISSRLDTIEKAVSFIEQEAPKSVQAYHDRLYNKIKESLEALGRNDVDEQRIVTEVAVFSDKVAVDEETVRLRSHIAQFRELIKSEEPVGRKLDFIVQEMNRRFIP